MQAVAVNKHDESVSVTRSQTQRRHLVGHIMAVDDRHQIRRMANSHGDAAAVRPTAPGLVVSARSWPFPWHTDWVVAGARFDRVHSIGRQINAVVDRSVACWSCSRKQFLFSRMQSFLMHTQH